MFTWRKDFFLLLMRAPKLPRKSLIFFLLLICGDIELCPGPQENVTDISKLIGIKLVHQNIRGLLSKKDILETFVYKRKIYHNFVGNAYNFCKLQGVSNSWI